MKIIELPSDREINISHVAKMRVTKTANMENFGNFFAKPFPYANLTPYQQNI
jgi:hypothetical protein